MKTLRVVVDQREGQTCVVVSDEGASFDVPARHLPKECRAEGAVLDVDIDAKGKPDWKTARRNREEEQLRQREGAERLDRLRSRDPGGDVKL